MTDSKNEFDNYKTIRITEENYQQFKYLDGEYTAVFVRPGKYALTLEKIDMPEGYLFIDVTDPVLRAFPIAVKGSVLMAGIDSYYGRLEVNGNLETTSFDSGNIKVNGNISVFHNLTAHGSIESMGNIIAGNDMKFAELNRFFAHKGGIYCGGNLTIEKNTNVFAENGIYTGLRNNKLPRHAAFEIFMKRMKELKQNDTTKVQKIMNGLKKLTNTK